MSIAKGGQAPTKRELTVEDLLAEVRAPRPGEEDSLEAPILAEKTAGAVEEITQPVTSNLTAQAQDGMRVHKNNIGSVITDNSINFYTFEPDTQERTPIPELQGIIHRLPNDIISIDQMVIGRPFVIEYADAKKGRWVSVLDVVNKKIIHLIQMKVSGKIRFEGDMIRVPRDGQEERYFFYKDGNFYEFDTKAYYGYESLLSGLMKKVIKTSTGKKTIPHDYEDAKKYLIPKTTPVIIE